MAVPRHCKAKAKPRLISDQKVSGTTSKTDGEFRVSGCEPQGLVFGPDALDTPGSGSYLCEPHNRMLKLKRPKPVTLNSKPYLQGLPSL